jgi:hypothetical protein
VYAKVMSGPTKDRTFDGTGLVETRVNRTKRHARIVEIREEAIAPLAEP